MGSRNRRIYHKLLPLEEALGVIEQHVSLKPLGVEKVKLEEGVGRVLAENVQALVDSPPFDRSLVDGYAVRAEDLYEAEEDSPVLLRVVGSLAAGDAPSLVIGSGECVEVATGAPLPALADSVIMVEYTHRLGDKVLVYRKLRPGDNVGYACTDFVKGEVVAWQGSILTPELIGAIAAAGVREVVVYKKPVVALIATGDELLEPGVEYVNWKVYDTNTFMLYAALTELGCTPLIMGTCRDEYSDIRDRIDKALEKADVILITGGTSAGVGDLVYRVLESYEPGVIVHGLKLKPGKPTVIGVSGSKLIFGLPGFPLSCYMVFNLLVKPVLARLAGIPERVLRATKVRARVALRMLGVPGRRRLVPVTLKLRGGEVVAYPISGDNSSIFRLSLSDGFFEIPENVDYVAEGEAVEVSLFREIRELPDLTVMGSHCPALELLLDKLRRKYSVRALSIGSAAGLRAVANGVADIAGIHLYDPENDVYNISFIRNLRKVVLIRGYSRKQGFIVARGNPHNVSSMRDVIEKRLRIINRVRGSGTRSLIDQLIKEAIKELKISFNELVLPGYNVEARTHHGVALAVLQGKADVGVGIEYVAKLYDLDFIPVKEEIYDFIVRREELTRPPVREFISLLRSEWFRELLSSMPGYRPLPDTGMVVS